MTEGKSLGYVDCSDLANSILAHDLCCGCGACVGVCPAGALKIDSFVSHTPVLDEEKCSNCGLCYKVCPGKGYPVVQLCSHDSNKDTIITPLYGPVRYCAIGHALDHAIRSSAASGGIATALLLYSLESGMVNEVAVVAMKNQRPKVMFTDDPDVVRASAQSKYAPVPMGTIIGELRTRPRRIAATFTPCQLAGISQAMSFIPKLRECLALTVGLFCGHVQTYDSLSGIAASLGYKYPGEVEFIGWRCGKYPGNTRFRTVDGLFVDKPLYESYDIAIPHFSLKRCFLCPDGDNWLADISLGDIHSRGIDQTIIVCRTQRGQDILESAHKSAKIEYSIVRQTHGTIPSSSGFTNSKLLPAMARIKWLEKRNKPAPRFDYPNNLVRLGSKGITGVNPVIQYRLVMWARKGWRRRLLLASPKLLERVGHLLYHFPCGFPGYVWVVKLIRVIRKLTNRNRTGQFGIFPTTSIQGQCKEE